MPAQNVYVIMKQQVPGVSRSSLQTTTVYASFEKAKARAVELNGGKDTGLYGVTTCDLYHIQVFSPQPVTVIE